MESSDRIKILDSNVLEQYPVMFRAFIGYNQCYP